MIRSSLAALGAAAIAVGAGVVESMSAQTSAPAAAKTRPSTARRARRGAIPICRASGRATKRPACRSNGPPARTSRGGRQRARGAPGAARAAARLHRADHRRDHRRRSDALVRELGPQFRAHLARRRPGRWPCAAAHARGAEAPARADGRRGQLRQRSLRAGPTDFTLYDRCITRGLPSVMFPAIYNNNTRIVQAPGYVALTHEMIHETRVIPLDGRPFTSERIRGYLGDARARWEGDTLVVETQNFSERDQLPGRGRHPAPGRAVPARAPQAAPLRSDGDRPAHLHAAVDGGRSTSARAWTSSSTPVTKATTRCGTCSARRGRLRQAARRRNRRSRPAAGRWNRPVC